MSQHILTIHQSFMVPVIEGLIDFIKRVKQNRDRNKDIKITIKELQALTNRELSDLGISRGEIYSVAHRSADEVYGVSSNKNLSGWV